MKNHEAVRRTLFAQTMQEYEQKKSREKSSREKGTRNDPPATGNTRNNHGREENKRSTKYQVKIQPPNRRISTLKKPMQKNMVLQNNSEAIIDTRRNNAWQSDHINLNLNEEDKVEEIPSDHPAEESKILSIVNRELDVIRREQLNDSQEGADIGVRLLDTPNVNQRERVLNDSISRDSQILNIANERERLI